MTVTTIKLHTRTRDRLRDTSRALEATYDETIEKALAALDRERRRDRMARESFDAFHDEADRAEVAAVRALLDGDSAR